MITNLIELEDGLGVVIEQELLDRLKISAETRLSVVVVDNRIVVTPISDPDDTPDPE